MWQPLVEHLKNDFNVVVPRLPLFDLPIQHTNLKYLVKVLHEFIEWHKLSNTVIVGHALGAQLALLYAHNYPDNVDRLVLCGSSGFFENAMLEDALNQQKIDYEFVNERVQSAFYNQPTEASKLADEIYLDVQNIPKRLALNSYIRSSSKSKCSIFFEPIDNSYHY